MTRIRSLILSTLLAGCGGHAHPTDRPVPGESADTAGTKADGVSSLRPGNYSLQPNLDSYWSLALKGDGTYSLRGGCGSGQDGRLVCFYIVSQQGSYRLTKAGSDRYLRLYPNEGDGSLAYKFSYTVGGDNDADVQLTVLVGAGGELTQDGDVIAATLAEADKRQEGESCGGFVGAANACADGLSCQASAGCCDLPGTCVRPSSSGSSSQ
jgi:hypothetical protein